MAENPIVMEAVYGPFGEDSQVPIDREKRVKDVTALIRSGGGTEKFIARIDRLKAEQQQQQRLTAADRRADAAEQRAQQAAGFAKTLFQQGQELQEENLALNRFLTTGVPMASPEEKRAAAIEAGGAGLGLAPDVRRGERPLLPSRFYERTPAPAEGGLPKHFRPRAAQITESDLGPRAKAAAMQQLQTEAIAEQEQSARYGMTPKDVLDYQKSLREEGQAGEALAADAVGLRETYQRMNDLQASLHEPIEGEGEDAPGLVGPMEGTLNKWIEQYSLGEEGEEKTTRRRRLQAFITEEVLKLSQMLKGSISEGEIALMQDAKPKLSDPVGVWEKWFNDAKARLEKVARIKGINLTGAPQGGGGRDASQESLDEWERLKRLEQGRLGQ